jgi:ADP-dependent NAD(P)H-hydrate dehydratase / NAD(P)H-hydrate epimerase
MSLPIYNSKQMSNWDAFTILNEPVSSLDLMERAASLACKQILGNNLFSSAAIVCGPGNNGGDGLVIARLLHECGKKVKVYYLDSLNYSDDFKANLEKLPKKIETTKINDNFSEDSFSDDIIIDCLFGTGLKGPIQGIASKVVETINCSNAKVIAIDIPSGLASEGVSQYSETTVRATLTLTFMSPKMSFFYAENNQFIGDFVVLKIDLHPNFSETPFAHFLRREDIQLKKRQTFDHKGILGYLTLIAGSVKMPGAAILSARSAMKTGAGYVDTITTPDSKQALMVSQAEVICQLNSDYEISAKTKAIAIGPGLGKDEVASKLLVEALKTELPIVLDADAINMIAENDELLKLLPKNAILTPHLGELERLLGTSKDSEETLIKQIAFSKSHSVYVIQKGAFSKLTTPEGKVFINSTGNPGMASAGMGDVLTGIIGSLLAQGSSAEEAAKCGMFIHGYAADLHAYQKGEIGLLASDVIDLLPEAMNSFSI